MTQMAALCKAPLVAAGILPQRGLKNLMMILDTLERLPAMIARFFYLIKNIKR